MTNTALRVTSRRIGIGLIGVIVVLVFLVGCATLPKTSDVPGQPVDMPGTLGDMLLVYDNWDGPLNPHNFRDWRIIKHRPCPDGYPDYHILLQNPRGKPDAIEIVVVSYGETKLLMIRYGYRIDSIFYVFSVTSKNREKYVQVQPKEV